jgi:hypothetical protein
VGYDMTVENDTGLSEEKAYFRLNIFGMSDYRNVMQALGMLDFDAHRPPFPCMEEFLNDSEYQEACREITDAEAPTPSGIPPYKTGSSDGWLITPRELRAALATYDATTKVQRSDALWSGLGDVNMEERQYWNKWILFLRRAEKNPCLVKEA